MKTKKVQIKRHKTYLYCDKCESGYLNYNTMNRHATQQMSPPIYEHKCNNCGNVVWLTNDKYPTIEEVEINTRIRNG